MTPKKFLNNLEEYFCVWTLAIMTLVVFVQVVMRYVFANSLSWSEELARFIFLWLSWVGASYAVRERSHFRVEMLMDLFKGASRVWLEYLVLLIWFAFSFFFDMVRHKTRPLHPWRRVGFGCYAYPHDVALRRRPGRVRVDVRAPRRRNVEAP